MASYSGVNVTKLAAGATGDNVILDGYVNTVEKVWIDSYTFSAVLTTADTIAIAKVPANKKITGVKVYIPGGFTPTTTTINVGMAGDKGYFITSAALTIDTALVNVYTMNNVTGFSYVTTDSTTILFSLSVAAITAPTAGTIKTIVLWT